MTYAPRAVPRPDRYRVPVADYRDYHRDGYLRVPSLLASVEVARLSDLADALLTGRETAPSVPPAAGGSAPNDVARRLVRVHMLHREHPTAEWGLLLPRALDVLEALIGPDVLALQSMLFFNPPGQGGQGWHQDAYYITTYPDTLIGAWMALEPADEENGCLWVVPGSHCEPIYPPAHPYGSVHAAGSMEGLAPAANASSLDDDANALSAVVRGYPPMVPVPMQPGDVLFFHSHLLHRSFPNRATARSRRAYVCHYCNARSWVPWNHGAAFEGESANALHILARGATHLPFARPAFGSPVSTARPELRDSAPSRMVAMAGDMEPASAPALADQD